MELKKQVERTIREQELLQAGQKVAVACSGGADSVALLRLLDELKDDLGLQLRVCHLNHQLRGEESDADEVFVERLARRRELDLFSASEKVAARAKRNRQNLEEAAREARLEFFAGLIERGEAEVIALAHTLDDQAETVFQRLVRGAGTRGLAGIYPLVEMPRGVRIVRPLLGVRREELRKYLKRLRQKWQEDSTNKDKRRTRNRVRIEVLPGLNPGAIEHLARLAAHAREEESFWNGYIETIYGDIVTMDGPVLTVNIDALQGRVVGGDDLPLRRWKEAGRAVARRVLRRALKEVRGDLRRISAEHVESALRLATEGQSGRRADLPGVTVERHYGELRIRAAGAGEESGKGGFEVELTGPGVVDLPSGASLKVKFGEVGPSHPGYNVILRTALDADRAGFPLVVRNWRPGDQYRPRDDRRARKLKELFQRSRVPRRDRARCPIVLSRGEIVWTAPFGPAAAFVLGPKSRRAIWFEETRSR